MLFSPGLRVSVFGRPRTPLWSLWDATRLRGSVRFVDGLSGRALTLVLGPAC